MNSPRKQLWWFHIKLGHSGSDMDKKWFLICFKCLLRLSIWNTLVKMCVELGFPFWAIFTSCQLFIINKKFEVTIIWVEWLFYGLLLRWCTSMYFWDRKKRNFKGLKLLSSCVVKLMLMMFVFYFIFLDQLYWPYFTGS